MAQFLLSVHHALDVYNAGSAYGAYPDEDTMRAAYGATGAFNQRLRDAGVWVFAGGLVPPEGTTTVDGTGSEPQFTDGPPTESAEYVGGFWIIEVASREDALRWAADGSRACGARVQVRAFQGS